MHRAIGQRRLGAQQVIARKFTLRLADPQSGGGIALRIEIDEQRTPAGRRECGGQIDRGRRLAYPALLVRDRDPDHDYPRFFGTIRPPNRPAPTNIRSEEHTSELQSLMRISYAVFCLKKKKYTN